jgi:predicted restriction endonuclease
MYVFIGGGLQMYIEIINEIKTFLSLIKIDLSVIDAVEFQGVFIKKLSNQNIFKIKRRVLDKNVTLPNSQTQIDISSSNAMLFFFENLTNASASIQPIDIDMFTNNLNYLSTIDTYKSTMINGYTVFSRKTSEIINLENDTSIYHSTAFKKYEHSCERVQLNVPDQNKHLTKLQNLAYLDDALVLLRYNYSHYLAIIIPKEFCNNLYSLTHTFGNQAINFSIPNTAYNSIISEQLQKKDIFLEVKKENTELESLQEFLLQNKNSGPNIEKIIKSCISQGAFRRLLMLANPHKCRLCSVTTTSVLRASYIKSWTKSSKEERLDINNGLLLCANHSSLFNKHLISFNPDNGKICISKSINEEQRNILNISNTQTIIVNKNMYAYMKLHNDIFSKKNTADF